jgi:hypothetical protein
MRPDEAFLLLRPYLNSKWSRSSRAAIQSVVAMTVLGKLLREAFLAQPANDDRQGVTRQEVAHRLVWGAVAADMGEVIAHSAIPIITSSDAQLFLERAKSGAMSSAASRRTSTIPTVEAAYTLLLRWLGMWDPAFDAEQANATARYNADVERVRLIREGSRPQERSVTRSARPAKSPQAEATATSDRLIAALRAREGSVLERGVRVLGANRFKSYKSVLEQEWDKIGGTMTQLDERLYRNDIEALSEEGGYSGGRSAGQRAAIIEYVVHHFDERT